ncbi:IclR family transcriptional regulator [Rhizobiales bacterium L72]|uniref:IclR family transcriptional regulator n=1 Tax=Propylenella binzhouense TaxID=2555902 RepID=A0A964WTN8_9HYPH|nr:IclR family transcriptional regulator [Propylenella binzhouense]MYZ48183.1 IclR family transcriptional regulator [Propylenella binzhouense]
MQDQAVQRPRRGRPASAGGEPASEVQSLDRAISILEAVAAADGVSLSEIARRTGYPVSTVHRLLATLQNRGLASHDPATGLWMVGVGLFRLGSAYLRIRKLPEIARPIIREVLEAVDETVNVTVVDGDEIVCVAQAESHAAVRAFFRLGRRLPFHASAAGKAVLAASSPERQAQLVERLELETFTPNTAHSRKKLMKRLAETTSRGYAIDDEEHTPGMRCVAAAILDEWGEPVGAVSISAPSVRMPAERIESLGAVARETAARLTTLYSGREPADS